jgi:hypothetical protein
MAAVLRHDGRRFAARWPPFCGTMAAVFIDRASGKQRKGGEHA